jgi:hypothetical protein
MHKVYSIFTSRCLLAASKDGSSSGYPNYLRPQLLTSHFSKLQNCKPQLTQFTIWTTNPRYTVPARTSQKTSLPLLSACSSGETMCAQNCSLATAVVWSLVYTAVTWQWVCMSQYELNWIQLAQDGDQLLAFLTTVTNLQVPQKAKNFFQSLGVVWSSNIAEPWTWSV